MTATNKVLVAPQNLQAVDTIYYTSPDKGQGTIIDSISCTNYSAGTIKVSVNIPVPGGTAANPNVQIKTRSIAAGATERFPELTGRFIGPGYPLSFLCDTATAGNVMVTGRELT
jgi:hypothetical protein